MKKIVSLVLTYLMSTTLVFAQHTRSSIEHEIQHTVEIVKQAQAATTNPKTCTAQEKRKMLRKIDRKIRRAQRRNESLDTSVYKMQKKYDRFKKRQVRKTNRILNNHKRLNRMYRKLAMNNSELTKEALVDELKLSIAPETIEQERENITDKLLRAGSMENFLMDAKEFINNCDNVNKSIEGSDTWGLVLLILFVGTPILAILVALFALIFGAFKLALGLFIYAIVMVGVLLIISNVGGSNLVNSEE
jgi:hypothetical protein